MKRENSMPLEQIKPEYCCLLMIDLQEKLMKAIHRADEVIATSSLMLSAAKEFEIPIIPTTQYSKGLGTFVPEIETLLDDTSYFDKVEFNAVANSAVQEKIYTLPTDIDTCIITGVETHICILQTALGLQEMGKNVWIVADAVSSRREYHHNQGIALLQKAGAVIAPAETIIYMLLGQAGTPLFKKILPLIVAQ